MGFTNEEILFGSIVGSKLLEQRKRFALVENEIGKRVLPVMSLIKGESQNATVQGVSHDILSGNGTVSSVNGFASSKINQADAPVGEQQQYFPLTIILDKQRYTLPYEPMINISGKNKIVRRYVAKNINSDAFGSVKERWSRDDYEITITGILMGSVLIGDHSECFPRQWFEQLREILTAPASLEIECEPLQLLNINRIVIEEFNFPFTKGENVQAYEIKAYSDFTPKLLFGDSKLQNV